MLCNLLQYCVYYYFLICLTKYKIELTKLIKQTIKIALTTHLGEMMFFLSAKYIGKKTKYESALRSSIKPK